MLDFLTDFADQAVVLPVAVSVLAALALLGWRRAAAAWAICVAGTLGLTLVLKLLTMACGLGLETGLRSPSGHTAGAACVYGALPALLVRDARRGALVACSCAACVALAVGLTRLGLQVHTPADVVAGSIAGVAGAACTRRLAGTRPPALPFARLVAPVVVVMFFAHGYRLDAEGSLHWAALRIWPLTLCHRGDSHDMALVTSEKHDPR